MTAQIVQNPSVQNRGSQNHLQPSGDIQSASHKRAGERNGERTAAHTPAGREQNPELLQWRANVLLDEMMLGAVDIAASDAVQRTSTPTRSVYNGSSADYRMDEPAADRQTVLAEEERPTTRPTGYAGGAHRDTEGYDEPPSLGREELAQPHEPQDEWSRPAWHFAEPTSSATQAPIPALPPPSTMTPSARAVALQEHTRYRQTPPSPSTGPSRTIGRPPPNPDVRTAAVGAPPRPAAPASPKDVAKHNSEKSNTDQWVFAAEQRYQQIAERHQATPAPGMNAGWVDPTEALLDGFAANEYGYANGTSATAAAYSAGARQRINQAARRSNLLPRMSTLDPRALQQEMVMLQTELEQALPTGHESRERALHLLEKAYTILQADASRSAEVDYYLQQVRTIGQRVQETLRWSNLYHSRLNLYLVAWIVLSLIAIGGRYVYHTSLLVVIANFSGSNSVAESLLAHNLLTIFTAFFAGALGGAVGALINMRQYSQIKQGFFDRKYSLRGLILPLMGSIVGLVLCPLFGLIYFFGGADPATNLWLGALPALFAFAFGIAQEFIYGTHS